MAEMAGEIMAAGFVPAGPALLADVAGLPATAHLTVVSNHQGLAALESGWRALEANAQTPTTVFQSFDWLRAWSKVYVKDRKDVRLHILAGFDGGRLVFAWPLMLTRRRGVRVLTWLTEPFGQYGDVICDKGHCPRTWVANGLRYLRRLKGFDLLRLRHVRADSTLATVAEHELVDARLHERAPWLDLTQFKTEADYENRYTSSQRKRRKKIRKHLEDMGPVTFRQVPLGAQSTAAIRLAMSEKTKWLAERGRINRVIGSTSHEDFLKELSTLTGAQSLEPVVTELRAGDTPVSWEIGFRFGGTHFAYITSHVNAMTDLSPGRLHMDLSQRACLADGIARFDLMVPYDAHKESWSSACMDTKDYYLPFSLIGKVVGHLYLGRIRPILRSAYYKMPPSVLRLINRGKSGGDA